MESSSSQLDLSKIPFDYLEIDPKSQFCGIYSLYCVVNSKFYIGSTKNFLSSKFVRGRKSSHLSLLRKKKHHSIVLQYAVDKYGIQNFIWFKLAECEEKDLLNVEDEFLQKYRPFDRSIGFNINDKASGGLAPHLWSYYKFVNFEGKVFEGVNLSQFSKDQNCYPVFLRRVRDGKQDSHKGFISYKNIHRLEEIKLKERNKTYFKLISPSGEIIEGMDREKFCKDYNLERQYLIDLMIGKADTLHGWRKFIEGKHPNRNLSLEELNELDKEIEIKRLKNSKTWKFTFNNELIKIHNLAGFCKKNNLGSDMMQKASRGLRDTPYKGYSSPVLEISRRQWEVYNRQNCNSH